MLWERIARRTRAISDVRDPLERNRRVNAAYAEVFLASRTQGPYAIRWAGAAAFASKQWGCLMRSARSGAGRDSLARNNRAVFEEAYPAVRLYADGYHPRIEKCLFAAFERLRVAGPAVRALAILSEESGLPRPSREKQSAREMQRLGFLIVRQMRAFDRPRAGAGAGADRPPGEGPIEVAFSSSCRCDEAPFLVRAEDGPGDGRAGWRQDLRVAERFDDLADDPETAGRLARELEALRRAAE
jgi:hypothetical protein